MNLSLSSLCERYVISTTRPGLHVAGNGLFKRTFSHFGTLQYWQRRPRSTGANRTHPDDNAGVLLTSGLRSALTFFRVRQNSALERSMTQSFQPPVRTLMGPGPSDIHPRVLAAMARPTIGHLDPAFIAMMDEVKSCLATLSRRPTLLQCQSLHLEPPAWKHAW